MAKKPTKPSSRSASAKAKPQDPSKKAKVHQELEGFEIGVNALGEITSNYSIEEINKFLGRHVRDKKLVDRAGRFGEKPEPGETEDEAFPIEDGHHPDEPEETDEDFIRRSSSEARRKKNVDDVAAEADEARQELPNPEE